MADCQVDLAAAENIPATRELDASPVQTFWTPVHTWNRSGELSMIAVDVIEQMLSIGVLNSALTSVPNMGASEIELVRVVKTIGRPLSEPHARILKRWNGINLDIIRIYGATSTDEETRSLADAQITGMALLPGTIAFGDDPSGFIYGEDVAGSIVSFDSSCGELEIIASDMDDFFCRLVFGKDAEMFAGKEWAKLLLARSDPERHRDR